MNRKFLRLDSLKSEVKKAKAEMVEMGEFLENLTEVRLKLDNNNDFEMYNELLWEHFETLKKYISIIEQRIGLIESNPEKYGF